jgi:hypothetical protein
MSTEAEPVSPPGTRMSPEKEAAELIRIRSRFFGLGPRDPDPHHPGRWTFWWVLLPSGCGRIGPKDLKRIAVSRTEKLLLLLEFPRPGRIFVAEWQEILTYWTRPEIWGRETYVMPEDLSWFLAYTHEDWDEDDLILTRGLVPGL